MAPIAIIRPTSLLCNFSTSLVSTWHGAACPEGFCSNTSLVQGKGTEKKQVAANCLCKQSNGT